MANRLQRLLARRAEIEAKLNSPQQLAATDMARLGRELADLTPIADKAGEVERLEGELASAQTLLAEAKTDGGGDSALVDMAEEEIATLTEKLATAQHTLKRLLLPKDRDDGRGAIIELRAGSGGDEAALFAADLFGMYQRYASQHGWQCEVMALSDIGIGGYKEVVASIRGDGVFARLKFESGVHRVQRVPATEAAGRIHTSAATVAVLPEVEEVDIAIKDSDIRIDVFRSSGPGGQSVNTTDSAVRITHIPTGITVSQQDEKSQHKNRAKAMKILRARLYDAQRAAQEAARAKTRKTQIGSGDRSQRIRTYNFPQGRVTDHRINLTLYKLDQILAGDALDELVDALTAESQMALLADAETESP